MDNLAIVVVNKLTKEIYYEATDRMDAERNTPNDKYTPAVIDFNTNKLYEYKLVNGKYLSREMK